MTPASRPAERCLREVIIGRNSRVWKAAAGNSRVAERFKVAIGHAELGRFEFTADDRVWVFGYSRIAAENAQLLQTIQAAGVRELVYISSASTIVCRLSRCYEYPRVKWLAELEALRLRARVLVLGVVYARPEDLPAGLTLCTSQASIDDFLLQPDWPDMNGQGKHLLTTCTRPFRTSLESALHRIYGALIWSFRRWPCVLRPLDLLLRGLGIRWYGYVYLSNLLWITKKS